MVFKSAIDQVTTSLAAGDVDEARAALDRAWTLVKSKQDRTVAHDLGNKIQVAIFEKYMA